MDVSTTFVDPCTYMKSPRKKEEVIRKVQEFATATGINVEGGHSLEAAYAKRLVIVLRSIYPEVASTRAAESTSMSESPGFLGMTTDILCISIVRPIRRSGIGCISQETTHRQALFGRIEPSTCP